MTSPSAVPFDDASLGFTATDLLGTLATPTTGQLTWYDGTSTALHFQIRYDQPKVQIWHSADPACGEMNVDGAVISLTTDDGRLSGDDFPGTLSRDLLDGQVTTRLNFPWRRISDLHGSFRAPSAWSADVSTQGVTVGMAARSETCSVCALSTDPRGPAFTNGSVGCEYDGKIYWTGSNDQSPGCVSQFTVAAWQFSQQP